jgi:hypothetical protein
MKTRPQADLHRSETQGRGGRSPTSGPRAAAATTASDAKSFAVAMVSDAANSAM